VRRAAEITSVTLRVEKAGSLAFHDDGSDWAARGRILLRAVSPIVASAAAKLLIVILVRPLLMLLLLLRLGLLIPAILTVSVAVPESAEPSAPLAASLAAAVLTGFCFGATGPTSAGATSVPITRGIRLAISRLSVVVLRLARDQRYRR
jgi:hypothetical protein